MQYTQRKLQRSVTEIRRYSMLRPNWSRSVASSSRHALACIPASRLVPVPAFDPLARSVDVVLELPDRHALLELLDHVAARVVRGAAMRMRDGDRDARVAELERRRADARRRCRRVPNCSAASRAMSASSRSAIGAIRGVFHARHRASVVDVAHGADEQQRRAVRVLRDFARSARDVDRPIDERGAHQPPATGGMIAISSPAARTRSRFA